MAQDCVLASDDDETRDEGNVKQSLVTSQGCRRPGGRGW
jgi:hypothetical protein